MEILFPGMAALESNVHPLLVHFPIAFFIGALILEGAAVLYNEKFHFAATWMLYLGTLAALVTLPTGFIAADIIAATDPRGHNAPGHDYIHVHRNWMIATTLVSALLSVYLIWINQKVRWNAHRWRFLFGLVVLALLVSMGADRGGRLVYEFGTGVSPKALKEVVHEESEHGH